MTIFAGCLTFEESSKIAWIKTQVKKARLPFSWAALLFLLEWIDLKPC
jgi:hypothetical protein